MSTSTTSSTTNHDLLARRDSVLMGTYARPPIALVRGAGARVWDADGREYLDLVGGIAVSVLGHCHPAVSAAVTRQLGELGHVSNLYANEPAVALAERLCELLADTPGADPANPANPSDARVFFCNSGAEANETALKIARRTGRTEIVATEGSFHGRTLGALSVTGQPAKRAPFEPLLPGPRFVPYGDPAALRAAVGPDTAAVILEPTLGEGGVVPPPPGYLALAREVCDTAGALLILDEVQSGVGRTGAWFAHQTAGVRPDVITLAKGLGGGLPIGACLGLGEAGRLLKPGDHGSTFGGNPVVCRAALTVLDTIAADGLLDNVREVGARMVSGILAADAPLVTGVRGSGLWLAITLAEPVSAAVETAARERGFLVNAVMPDAIRLAPPLLLSAAQADAFVAALPGIAAQAAQGAAAQAAQGAAAQAAQGAAAQAAQGAAAQATQAAATRVGA